MSNRITKSDLDGMVLAINRAAGTPIATYVMVEGKYEPQKGNYFLDSAYGGHKLVQMGEGTGQRDISKTGFTTKKELYYEMQGYLNGIRDYKYAQEAK